MKSIYLFFGFLLICIYAQAQIPNASFENWTDGSPDGWTTNNNTDYQWITQDNSAHAGTSGAKSSVLNIGVPVISPLALGTNAEGAHTNIAPEAIHGWYILNSVSGDYMNAVAGMLNSSGGTGVGDLNITEPSSVYKEFIINMQYLSGVPNGDSIELVFSIFGAGASYDVHDGSYFVVDDLSYGAQGTTGVNEVGTGYNDAIENIYPAPSNGLTNIIYSVSENQKVQVEILNELGQTVKEVLDTDQTPGRYKAQTNNSDLPAGVYFVQLTIGAKQSVTRMIVSN